MGDILRPDLLFTQIVGFLIVLWVLKRFAWGPVLGMLEARRQGIVKDVDDAKSLREDAEKLKARYEEHLRQIEAESRQRIQEAVAEGQKVADEIRAKAQEDARRITEKASADLEMEYRKARASLRGDMVALSIGAAERLLQAKLDSAEQQKLVDRFLTDLQGQEAN